MNKLVYLGLPIVELIKILMYEFWHDYVKPKKVKNQNCVIWVQTVFIVYIKTDDIYKEIVEVVKNRFDTSNYKLRRSLPKRKNKNVNGLMKDEFGGKFMTIGWNKFWLPLAEGGSEKF